MSIYGTLATCEGVLRDHNSVFLCGYSYFSSVCYFCIIMQISALWPSLGA